MYTNRKQLVLPINTEILIPENDPVFVLAKIMDEMDLSAVYKQYQRRNSRKIDPGTLLSVILYGYMTGKYSSREIENACKTDTRFLWLLQGAPAPDHTTVSRFVSGRLQEVVETLFYELIEKLTAMGEVSFEHAFIDGTKIEANANRYTFVWAKAVKKNREKLLARISRGLERIRSEYGLAEGSDIAAVRKQLLCQSEMEGIQFQYGKGRHKTQLQRDYDTLTEWADKLERYEQALHICGKRNSYSKTDTDATFMRMKEDHMRNGQLKPGYNVQIAVQNEYCIGVGLFPNPTDMTTLIPFLDRMQTKSGHRINKVTADAGYSSEENFTYLEANGQEAFIKPADHEIRKTRRYKEDPFRIENMPYDPDSDTFTCPGKKQLCFIGSYSRRSDNGYVSDCRKYACSNCTECPFKRKCYKGSSKGRCVSFSQTYQRQKNKADEKLATAEGILLRVNRSIQVEGVFGVLKEDRGFRRFLMRGKRKNETQFFLLMMAFNVEKICARLRSGRFNTSLFPVSTVLTA